MIAPETKPDLFDPSNILKDGMSDPTPEQVARYAAMTTEELAADCAEETLFEEAFSIPQLGS